MSDLVYTHYDSIPPTYEGILFKGISENAFKEKGLLPMRTFSIFIKDKQDKVLGGISGVLFYESLYIDSLWIDESLRKQGLGTKLMDEAENFGKKQGAKFITLNTMDWEGLHFYQKLGFSIEFIRDGYAKDSKMFLLRKNLTSFPHKMTISRIGVYALCSKNDKLLLVRQISGPHKGKWELPGGGLQPPESIEEALHRELLEEIGMTFTSMHPFANITAVTPWADGLLHQIGLIYQIPHLSPKQPGQLTFDWIDPKALTSENSSPFVLQIKIHLTQTGGQS